jgi:hypothetical protein
MQALKALDGVHMCKTFTQPSMAFHDVEKCRIYAIAARRTQYLSFPTLHHELLRNAISSNSVHAHSGSRCSSLMELGPHRSIG